MTIHELIARFRSLHADSTPAPWEATYGAQRDPVCVFPIAGAKGNEPKEFFIHGANGKHGKTNQEADAAIIIAMHTRLPEILDVLEKAIADRDSARAMLVEAQDWSISAAAYEVIAERRRQQDAEGWTPEHDDAHASGELAAAASCYALPAGHRLMFKRYSTENDDLRDAGRAPRNWPAGWAASWWKPTTPRRDLVKAGALILAEIERLDRAAAKGGA